jgi:hypothetical protein
MRHFFTLSVIALAALLGACGDNATTPNTTTTGEIYGNAFLINEYGIPLANNSGITAQLLEDGKVIQNLTTSSDGTYSFKNVLAGVYDLIVFKPGFAVTYTTSDSIYWKNNQFVGRGRFRIGGDLKFSSILTPDSSYWGIKPDIRYEVIKEIKEVNNVWIKDTVIRRYSSDSIHWDPEYRTIFGRGTSETRKIRFTIDYERPLPFAEMKREVRVFNSNDQIKNITTDANVLFADCEFISPNTIIRDSTGKIVDDRGGLPSSSRILTKEITVEARVAIPNATKQFNNPVRYSKSSVLKLSLID